MVDVSGAHGFSYLEEWSPIVLQDRKCTESVSSRKSHLRTVKILQNAFSHIMFLCPQRSDRAIDFIFVCLAQFQNFCRMFELGSESLSLFISLMPSLLCFSRNVAIPLAA